MTPWRTFWLAVLICLAGLAIAVWGTGNADDAGRGGAVAVALSFWILFQNHGSAERAYNDAAAVPEQQTRTHNALGALINASEAQKWPLSMTSVMGTLVWGFADIPARWLGAL